METTETKSEKLLLVVEQALQDMKAIDSVSMDVREVISFADYIIVTSGRSSRHVRALADSVMEAAKKENFAVLGIEGYEHSEWILVDLGYIVVHLMQPEQRQYYELEKLWLDAPIRTAK